MLNPENSSTINPAAKPRADVAGSDRSLRLLAQVLELEKRVRHCESETEIGFTLCNETHNLVRYRQSLLWKHNTAGQGKVITVSGLVTAEKNAPFIVWISKVFRHLTLSDSIELKPLGAPDLPEALQQEWSDWLPEQGLLVPLHSPQGELTGILFLVREAPWNDSELTLLASLADAYGHAWFALSGKKSLLSSLTINRNKVTLLLVILFVALCFFPIRQSVIAPAEVIPRNPVIVRSAVDGVIKEFQVQPNQVVKKDQPLLVFDDARIANQLEIAIKAMQSAEAEYRQAAQQAVFDSSSKAGLSALRGQVEQHAAEVGYYQGLLERIVIRSPRDGIAIFDDVNDWVGRPVALGERILLVADPNDVELEIQLPVADAIALESGADVQLFLNVSAHKSIPAELRFLSYQAGMNPAGAFAYRLVAEYRNAEDLPRIGLKGSAKLYGEKTILAVYLLRRPYFAVRQYLGL
ncbi:efflux RND transporter periplasmic adaptor subunit [Neptunomonas sp.]|uniref:efflux RND transporter periplasmic adaptor subunit n=1 Tax=Neptunomonas sp. TaxID=1971898 RepID=UPI00356B33BD